MPPISRDTLKVEPYCYDERIGWNTYIVSMEAYGVFGFTDGPAVPQEAGPK